jgi:hypothetical protein
MASKRRKWGWWLVAAIAVAVAASLFLLRKPDAPSGKPDTQVPDSGTDSAVVSVVRDTVLVTVDGDSVPVVRERKVEAGESDSEAAAAAETVVSVPLKDLNGLLREKSGRDLTLTTEAPDRIVLTYAGKVDIPMIGEQDMNFSADFKVVEVKGDRLVVQLDSGAALNAAADLLAPRIMERLPEGLVDSFSNGRAVINLSAVPQLKKKLNGVEIVGFSLDQEAISLRTVKK